MCDVRLLKQRQRFVYTIMFATGIVQPVQLHLVPLKLNDDNKSNDIIQNLESCSSTLSYYYEQPGSFNLSLFILLLSPEINNIGGKLLLLLRFNKNINIIVYQYLYQKRQKLYQGLVKIQDRSLSKYRKQRLIHPRADEKYNLSLQKYQKQRKTKPRVSENIRSKFVEVL